MLTLDDDGLEGFSQADCDLVNRAVSFLIAKGFEQSHAENIAINNWSLIRENTVGSLTGFPLGDEVQRFEYRAFYRYDGPSNASPLRTELSADEIDDALSLFPQHLPHFLEPTASVEADEYRPGSRSRTFTVVTGRAREETDGAVAKCLRRFDLYADRTPGTRPSPEAKTE